VNHKIKKENIYSVGTDYEKHGKASIRGDFNYIKIGDDKLPTDPLEHINTIATLKGFHDLIAFSETQRDSCKNREEEKQDPNISKLNSRSYFFKALMTGSSKGI
jgi:hypothetical protein